MMMLLNSNKYTTVSCSLGLGLYLPKDVKSETEEDLPFGECISNNRVS